MIPCSLAVNAGDSIGVYGARGTTNVSSYATSPCVSTILGNTVAFTRSGMQFPLYNQQMHAVWSEATGSISRVIMYVDGSTSVPETIMDPALLSIYPNPSGGIFTVVNGSKTRQQQSIEINNVLGEKVYSANLKNQPSNEIDLSAYPKGIYTVKIYNGENMRAEKIIIQKRNLTDSVNRFLRDHRRLVDLQ